MLLRFWLCVVVILLMNDGSLAISTIDNAIAHPEIIRKISNVQFEPRCEVKGKPLDLLFVLDSSGSLREQFGDEVNVIRRIVNHVAIDRDATRVALVQFSGIQRTEFHFNTFYRRTDVLRSLDGIRPISGITKTGEAFAYSHKELTEANGLRGPEVPKVVFLLSDGRTHDYPDDKLEADILKRQHNVDIWCYGTGNYVATEALVNITGSMDKIVTNKNLDELEARMFAEYKGIEVCEEVPVCIPGTDKPVDLMFIVDTSDSLDGKFKEQINFVRRVLNNVNVHPDAVRVALITFSGRPNLAFDFNRFVDNQGILDYLFTLNPVNGTTRTHLALRKAFATFDSSFGARGVEVPKMVIVLTDGHSQTNPATFAKRLIRSLRVNLFAVSVTPVSKTDVYELGAIGDHQPNRIFTQANLDQFELTFSQFVSFGCPAFPHLQKSEKDRAVRGPVDVSCTDQSISFTVRTMKPFTGWLYASGYSTSATCMVKGTGEKQTSIVFFHGQCGIERRAVSAEGREGYEYSGHVQLQFHTDVITGADKSVDLKCFYPTKISNDILGKSTIKLPTETKCLYTLHRYGPDGCVALEAQVGETLYHQWSCNQASNYGMLVHDCIAENGGKSMPILDSDGCELDPYLLETPIYLKNTVVHRDSSVFKFPGATSTSFRCKISLCDLEGGSACRYMIPPVCDKDRVMTRSDGKVKPGFAATLEVQTRTINVVENESLKPVKTFNFCSTFLP